MIYSTSYQGEIVNFCRTLEQITLVKEMYTHAQANVPRKLVKEKMFYLYETFLSDLNARVSREQDAILRNLMRLDGLFSKLLKARLKVDEQFLS